jgi:hypothetical protein
MGPDAWKAGRDGAIALPLGSGVRRGPYIVPVVGPPQFTGACSMTYRPRPDEDGRPELPPPRLTQLTDGARRTCVSEAAVHRRHPASYS